jgi:apolipoprotein N-acyltransferase
LVLLSAAVHALAFPPWNYSILAFVAVVPFLVVIRGLGPLRAALTGHLWGSAAIWGVGYWVADALTFYYQQPWWFGVLFCLVGCQILWGSYYAVFAAAASGLPRLTPWLRPLVTSIFWVGCELARARLLTGEPWMLLGYALVPHVYLMQAADIGGVYLLSFCVILVNASLAELWLCAPADRAQLARQVAVAPAVLCVAMLLYGVVRVRAPMEQAAPVRITVVQGNNDLGIQWREEFYGAGLTRYSQLSRQAAAADPDILVWPESAVTFFLAHEPAYQAALAAELQALGSDLIVGAPHHVGQTQFYNSAFYMTADGRVMARYDKGHLLPFAEYFPLRFIEFLRRNFERVRYFTPGDGTTLLPTRAGPAAVLICFEAIFPEIVRQQTARGARWLVNLSNDVWLGRGVGQRQHLAMVVLRAVENRLWIVRATTTGISAVIDPHGRVVAQSPLATEDVLHASIVPLDVPTLYKRWGDVFAYACAVVSLLALARMRLRPRAHDVTAP